MEWVWEPRGGKVTVGHVRELINKAEEEFRWCWHVFADLRFGKSAKPSLDLLTLQPRLAKALFALEHCYHQLKKQDRLMITRKAALKRSHVESNLRKTKALRLVLNHCIDVGKVLGDSFAWFFYQNEHKLLQEHQKHQPIERSAVGTGGIGEITYLENLPVVNDYLVIYHGTTTFLRLGDISMIDMRTLKVAAIGELKSHRLAPDEISISVNLVGRKLKKDLMPISRPDNRPSAPVSVRTLNSKQLDRLQRQIATLHRAFGPVTGHRLRAGKDVTVDWNTDQLSQLAQIGNTARFQSVKADRGLLLVGVKLRKQKLWSTFTHGAKAKLIQKLRGLEERAKAIVDPSIPDNKLIIGWLLYRSSGRYKLLPGMRPILWWPIQQELIEALLFRRLLVMTTFNPAFLIKDLRDRGFSVGSDERTGLTITKSFGGASLSFVGFEHFLLLIQQYLLSETAVIQIFENSISTLEAKEFPIPARITLQHEFVYQ